MSDKLLKLLFEKKDTRAVVLHLDGAWEEMMKNQNLPTAVKELLGKMCAGAIMLAAGLKFNGALVLQLQGDGPVKLAIVEVRTGLVVRATAQLRVPAESIPEVISFKDLVNVTGKGRCAVILDASDRRVGEQPYQGVVVLEDSGVEATLENYMTHSEQLETRLWLAANNSACGGVLLQRIPKEGGIHEDALVTTEETPKEDDDGFTSITLFAETVKAKEILTLDADTLSERLFWEDNPRILGEAVPVFRCRCSRDGIEAMVKNLGEKTAKEIVSERGSIEVKCEFCGKNYKLDAIDVASLFENGTTQSASSEKH